MYRMMMLHCPMLGCLMKAWSHSDITSLLSFFAAFNKYAANVVSVLNVSEMPEYISMFPSDYK